MKKIKEYRDKEQERFDAAGQQAHDQFEARKAVAQGRKAKGLWRGQESRWRGLEEAGIS